MRQRHKGASALSSPITARKWAALKFSDKIEGVAELEPARLGIVAHQAVGPGFLRADLPQSDAARVVGQQAPQLLKEAEDLRLILVVEMLLISVGIRR